LAGKISSQELLANIFLHFLYVNSAESCHEPYAAFLAIITKTQEGTMNDKSVPRAYSLTVLTSIPVVKGGIQRGEL
jgi:hypothetical protein